MRGTARDITHSTTLMPHPCSYWAVRTFGKTDPNRTTFESITDITDAFRAELTAEEEKIGRPALPKLVYEHIEINDQAKKKRTAKPATTTKVVEAGPAFSASALDGAATVSDAAWVKTKFAVGVAVTPSRKTKDLDEDQKGLVIEKVEGQVVTLKRASGKTTTMTKTALMEGYSPVVADETKATRWVPMRVSRTRRRRRRRRGGDVYDVTW